MPLQRTGAINGDPNARALFLDIFGGDVLARYDEMFPLRQLVMTKNVSGGLRSARFPVFGNALASPHLAGESVNTNVIAQEEKVIGIDAFALAAVEIADVDEILEHYDSRSEYANKLAEAIARYDEETLVRTLMQAGFAAPLVDGGFGGTTIVAGGDADPADQPTTPQEVTAQQLLNALEEMAAQFDLNNIDHTMERYCLISPEDYYKLVRDTTAVNRDFDGSGSFSKGMVGTVLGWNLVKSNRLHAIRGTNFTNNPRGTSPDNDYRVDATGVVATCFCRESVGSLRVREAMVDIYEKEEFVDQLRVRNLTGHGVCRPEATGNIVLPGTAPQTNIVLPGVNPDFPGINTGEAVTDEPPVTE